MKFGRIVVQVNTHQLLTQSRNLVLLLDLLFSHNSNVDEQCYLR